MKDETEPEQSTALATLVLFGVLLMAAFLFYANQQKTAENGQGAVVLDNKVRPAAENMDLQNRPAAPGQFEAAFVDESQMDALSTPLAAPEATQSQTETTGPTAEYCGDAKCGLAEDCSACQEDCGCKGGQYCSEAKSCAPKIECGDGICTKFEKDASVCCSDCGCTTGVCNPAGQKCEKPAGMTAKAIGDFVSNYVKETGFDLKSYKVIDDFYGGQPVKLVFLDCGTNNGIVCSKVLTVSADGKVLQEAYAN